ncbi:MAG: hypothetical protein E7318_01295 [Clostridiales bacterium]|nr:hypothetical protein [Clostridiales bacterium]
MTKVTTKHNKKEEQKKMAVRIICLVLVVMLALGSLIGITGLFQGGQIDPQLQAMIDAGLVYLAEDGNYYYTEEYINLLTEMSTVEEEEHTHE